MMQWNVEGTTSPLLLLPSIQCKNPIFVVSAYFERLQIQNTELEIRETSFPRSNFQIFPLPALPCPPPFWLKTHEYWWRERRRSEEAEHLNFLEYADGRKVGGWSIREPHTTAGPLSLPANGAEANQTIATMRHQIFDPPTSQGYVQPDNPNEVGSLRWQACIVFLPTARSESNQTIATKKYQIFDPPTSQGYVKPDNPNEVISLPPANPHCLLPAVGAETNQTILSNPPNQTIAAN